MKILFITPSPPSRFHRIRSFNLIKTLAKNHSIVLLSLSHTKSLSISPEIKSFCIHSETVYKTKIRSYFDSFLSLFSRRPLEVAYCSSSSMRKKVEQLCNLYNIDVVYVKRLRSAQFALGLSIPIVLDTTDAMSLFYKRRTASAPWYSKLLYFIEYKKHVWYEKYVGQHIRTWISCSIEDTKYLSTVVGERITLFLVPNGVDTHYFAPLPIPQDSSAIMFSGLMDKFVNSEAALFFGKKIFPLIKKDSLNSTFTIVGPSPTRQVRSLSSDHIKVVGIVEDIRNSLEQAAIVVCPVLTGTGTRNKILQAWACGRPVVSTPQGAEGLQASSGYNCLIASTPEDFARAVTALMQDASLAMKLVINGYDTVKNYYSLAAIEQSLAHSLDHAVQKSLF